MTQLDCHHREVSSNPGTLGAWLRERRQERELSRVEAARRASVSRQTWHAWESDKSLPQDQNYAAIDRALDWQRGSVAGYLAAGLAPTPIPEEAEPGLDERQAEILRESFEELRKEFGTKRALKLIDQITAEWRDRQREQSTRDDPQRRDTG